MKPRANYCILCMSLMFAYQGNTVRMHICTAIASYFESYQEITQRVLYEELNVDLICYEIAILRRIDRRT